MKLKQIIALGLATSVVATSAFALTGCGGGEKFIKDGKTINVRICKQGWGDAYFTAWSSAFESMYAEEGYKVNVVEASTSVEAQYVSNELELGDKNGVDLYIAGQCSTERVVKSSIDSGFAVAADLTNDVLNKPAQYFDDEQGMIVEESDTILSKLKPGFAEQMLMNAIAGQPEAAYNGKWYTMPISSSVSGIVVNTKLFEAAGEELPLTTNDLVALFNEYSDGKEITLNGKKTEVYPTVWAGQNAYNYWLACNNLWYAHYVGESEWYNFLNFDNIDITGPDQFGENAKNDILAIYDKNQNIGLYSAIQTMQTMLNVKNAVPGSLDKNHTSAQHSFLNDQAFIMANGSWLQNEMGGSYEAQSRNVKMINMPINSALGIKLALDGANGTNTDLCEVVLKKVITGIDNGQTNAEIIQTVKTATNVELTNEKVQAVRDARNLYYEGGANSQLIVNAFSDVYDIVVKFVRFIYSDVGINMLYTFATCDSPFNAIDPDAIDRTGASPFVQSISNISRSEDARGIHTSTRPGAKRSLTTIGTFNNRKYGGVDWILAMGTQSANPSGGFTAANLLDEELLRVKEILGING